MGADRIEVIYLDMDGVIADFITPSLLAADIPLKHDDVKQWNYYEPYMTAEEFWSRIAADDTFWLDIEPYPWAHELFDACKRVAPVIFCSSPCADPRCAAQKIQWLRINGFMGPDENNYILTPHKEHFAKPFRVLIDDSDKNIDNFNWHGGYGVTFPQNYNTLTQWTANRVSSVIDDLMNPPWDDPPQSALNSAPSTEHKDTNPKDSVGCTKPPMHCIPTPVLFEVGMGMYEGGWKYRESNWRIIGVRASIYYDAALRHLTAWRDGEDIDPASKIHHISKVMSCLAVLRDCQMQAENGSGVDYKDDRPPKSHVPMAKLEEQFKTMLSRLQAEHGDRKPPYTQADSK